MAECFTSSSQFVVNRFRHSGIPAALDGFESEEDSIKDSDKLSEDEDNSDDDFHMTAWP